MGTATPSAEGRRRLLLPAAVLGASALLLTACGQAPEASNSSEAAGSASATGAAAEVGSDNSDYTGCIVSDEGGFDDRSFNQSSYEGLKAAEEEFGIEIREAESNSVGEYVPNLNAMLDADCNLVVAVGFQLGDTMKPIAEENAETKFVGVDVTAPGFPENVRNIIYDTAQGAFLAGYLAAGMTETGTVATYGGMEIPTVSIFMDGFARGVEHYNEVKGEDVRVLGWDTENRTGSFIGDFSNQNAGKTNTANFINEGADIIMPVAGPVGLGTIDAVKEANGGGKDVKVIWVDSDGYETTQDGEVILTSVMKRMGDAVKQVIAEDINDEFTSEAYVGTLENDGVALAPFHDFEDAVPQELKDELEALEAGIVSGEIEVGSEDSPEA
ncbi:BMP family protein [Micrococcus endophyticus]|uniref:BMP family lipoprotein n=1 Tax=Micrococcus endophyticus TaxID=455343 RepID=UPI0035A87E30